MEPRWEATLEALVTDLATALCNTFGGFGSNALDTAGEPTTRLLRGMQRLWWEERLAGVLLLWLERWASRFGYGGAGSGALLCLRCIGVGGN